MYFSCDDSKISCDDKLDEASKCITGGFRALRRSSVLWDMIFRRPSRLQANTSLLLDLAAHLVLNEFQLILLHQTCTFAISSLPQFPTFTISNIQMNLSNHSNKCKSKKVDVMPQKRAQFPSCLVNVHWCLYQYSIEVMVGCHRMCHLQLSNSLLSLLKTSVCPAGRGLLSPPTLILLLRLIQNLWGSQSNTPIAI